jgi:hypothetical protein
VKFRSDNGREYSDHRVQDYFKRKGIRQEFTVSYTPEQNAVAERDNRTIMEMVRCMIFHRQMDKRFWGEAVNAAVYTLNRISSRTIHDTTPYEKWFGHTPDVKHLRTFGSIAYAHVPKELRKKLDSKTRECLFLGYSETSKAYRLWYPEKRGVILSRDVIFDEDSTDISSLIGDSSIFSTVDDLFPAYPMPSVSSTESSSSTSLPSASTSSTSLYPLPDISVLESQRDTGYLNTGKRPIPFDYNEVSHDLFDDHSGNNRVLSTPVDLVRATGTYSDGTSGSIGIH